MGCLHPPPPSQEPFGPKLQQSEVGGALLDPLFWPSQQSQKNRLLPRHPQNRFCIDSQPILGPPNQGKIDEKWVSKSMKICWDTAIFWIFEFQRFLLGRVCFSIFFALKFGRGFHHRVYCALQIFSWQRRALRVLRAEIRLTVYRAQQVDL